MPGRAAGAHSPVGLPNLRPQSPQLESTVMAGFFSKFTRKKQPDEQRMEPLRVGGVGEKTTYEAAERTELPLDSWMTRMMAQELPILDSTSRQRVRDILREYDRPVISSIDELPSEIRDIMELY